MPPVDVERSVLGAQVLLPHQCPGEIDPRNLAGREPGADALASGDRPRRRKVVLLGTAGGVALCSHVEFPFPAAARSIERAHHEDDAAVAARRTTAERPFARVRGIAALHEAGARTHDA